ncbi:P-loop containing nucleoside triphosphate hydrolase protein [Ceraceosorus guamensis]|uniref:P-loop containing nucleoside triphosphate hydrolase protein n=1 Tax=Ceraceosorus guamensis TaxID=1522189 RepID=A0A316W8H6_9BASI|nr:P-loop containing nucleoside triphosphate hydrolase protein [Ceraceosorus guamensis]PWN46197.1 P-loop containing nucleoside triphosphate hydrolase protein [Ceraceosorus guamensis]
MSCVQDAAFGPVSQCRYFDFTLNFSNIILSLLPSACLVAACHFRLPALAAKKDLAPGSVDPVGTVRVAVATLHAVLNAASLALVVAHNQLSTALDSRTIIPAASLSLVAAIAAIPLSYLERRKTARGDALLPLYLFGSCLFDACRIRTFAHVDVVHNSAFFALSIATVVVKGFMLIIENTSGIPSHTHPEERASFASRLFFLWLYPTIWKGYKLSKTRGLQLTDLDTLAPEYCGNSLRVIMEDAWQPASPAALERRRQRRAVSRRTELFEMWKARSNGKKKNDSDSSLAMEDLEMRDVEELDAAQTSLPPPPHNLVYALAIGFPVSLFLPIIPRLIVTAATLAQPFLVSKTLAFAQSSGTATDSPTAYGWGLVGAYALIYLVLATSNGQYYWLSAKTMVKMRGALIEIIYAKSLRLHLEAAKRTGGGKAANLVSVDVERIVKCVDPLHTLWSGFILIGVGLWILYSQLALVGFVAALFAIFIALALPPFVSSMGENIGQKQGAWSRETDARVNLVSSAIKDAKGLKFAAYEDAISKRLLTARAKEIEKAKDYLRRLILVVCGTNSVMNFMSFTIFSAIAIADSIDGGRRFNLNSVFTSLTTLGLLEAPLLQLGQQYASILAAFASCKRIESFLRENERPERSGTLDHRSQHSLRSATPVSDRKDAHLSASSIEVLEPVDSTVAARFERATLGWGSGKPILINVDLSIPAGKLTMICGRISSGKSTLLAACLGEADVLSGSTHLPLSRKPAVFCSQDSWLMEAASIRDNIVFDGVWDAERYATALHACGLDTDLQQLPQRDRTPAKSLSGGQRQRLSVARGVYADADAYILDDITSALDAETAAHLWRSILGDRGLLRGKTVIMATNAMHLLPSAALVVRLEDGKVAEAAPYESLSLKGKAAIRASIDTDRPTTIDTRAPRDAKKTTAGVAETDEDKTEEMASGSVSWGVYGLWLKTMGIWLFVISQLGTMGQVGADMGWPVWLQHWARVADAQPDGQTLHGAELAKYIMVFLSLALVSLASLPIELHALMVRGAGNAGTRLHQMQLAGVMGTSLDFFSVNPVGRVVNRFSQDLFTIDWELGLAASNLFGNGGLLIGQVIVLSVPAPYLLAVFAGITIFYVFLQRLYMPASRQLRRLEMAQKGPLVSSLGETTSETGLATLRALGRQATFERIMTARLDQAQKPYYTLWAVRRWLLTSLNLLAGVISCGLVLIVVLLRESQSVGLLGVALVQATLIDQNLNRTLISYTEFEIAGVALERIRAFADLPPEESSKSLKTGQSRKAIKPADVQGGIRVSNLTVAYTPTSQPALHNLSLDIKAGERIGVVGRSGSGKSTLLLALFRMLDSREGTIELDGLDIDSVTARSLRNALSIIPQNPLILAASVRDNLDPEGEHSDADLWDALAKTKLDVYVRSLSQGLQTMLLTSEATLSAGQQQLFSLSRAILRRRKVLVLDEATSSMDPQTDAEFQEVLQTCFSHCTIIAVAHRLATVIDFDRVLVLGNGRVLELDTPDRLLDIPDGVFRSLAKEQGLLRRR